MSRMTIGKQRKRERKNERDKENINEWMKVGDKKK